MVTKGDNQGKNVPGCPLHLLAMESVPSLCHLPLVKAYEVTVKYLSIMPQQKFRKPVSLVTKIRKGFWFLVGTATVRIWQDLKETTSLPSSKAS